jgi:hypothetical protein
MPQYPIRRPRRKLDLHHQSRLDPDHAAAVFERHGHEGRVWPGKLREPLGEIARDLDAEPSANPAGADQLAVLIGGCPELC